jgi:hypothetical protein
MLRIYGRNLFKCSNILHIEMMQYGPNVNHPATVECIGVMRIHCRSELGKNTCPQRAFEREEVDERPGRIVQISSRIVPVSAASKNVTPDFIPPDAARMAGRAEISISGSSKSD